jgi:ribosome biogenesis protein Tsr3
MKIYLVSQNENNEYDTYDSLIVSANSEEEARKITPKFGWASNLDNVNVEHIGEYIGTESKIILASFNAG